MGKLDGRCLCGSVSYTCDAEPLGTFLCHCTDCRRQSGAPMSIVVAVDRSQFEMTGETLAVYETTGTDSAQPRERWFCNRCGSPIVTIASELSNLAVIKAGTLDDPDRLTVSGELWCDSALDWTTRVADEPMQFTRGLGG